LFAFVVMFASSSASLASFCLSPISVAVVMLTLHTAVAAQSSTAAVGADTPPRDQRLALAAGDGVTSELPTVSVQARPESLGTTVLNKKVIDGTPGGNGDITSLLVTHPNVQFGSSQLRTSTLGEIAPADISINGAKYYDNLFLMDGMSFNSDINPAGAGSEQNSPSSPGQGLAIDTSLLCNITVRDANVGAEFGRFTGGVISAETCAPTKAFAGDVSVEHSNSGWVHYKYAPGQEQVFDESTTESAQPRFDKWTYRLALQGKVSDRLSLIGSVIRKTSEIPLRGYSANRTGEAGGDTKTQTRQSDNLYLKAFWNPVADVHVDAAVTHAPSSSRGFIENARNSYYENRQGGTGLNVGVSHPLGDTLTLNHRLTATQAEGSRDADADSSKNWFTSSDKSWGATTGTGYAYEGGYGDVEQVEKKLGYQLKGEWRAFQALGWRHALQSGLEYERMDYTYRRLTPYTMYTAGTATTTCALASGGTDTETCSLSTPSVKPTWTGQYLKSRSVYKAGEFDVKNESYAFFLQDELSRERVRLRAGLRYEHDQLSPQDSWSPRLAAFWDVLGNGRTQVEVGMNRYHGRNFHIYNSYKGRLSLQSGSQVRNLVGGKLTDWPTPVFGATATMYNEGELKTPHTDEQVLGISQSAFHALWSAKYVVRQSRDEVALRLRSAGNYWWDNVGKTDSTILTLSAATQRPVSWVGTQTHVSAAVDFTDTTTSHPSYDLGSFNLTYKPDTYIFYEGQFIRYVDRPANNYNRPWTARLMLSTSVPRWGLTVDNVLRLRDSYEKVAKVSGKTATYEGTPVEVWEKTTFSKAMTWDMRVNYTVPTVAGQSAYVSLTLENLLDRRNLIEASADTADYEKGRQLWVRVGYQF
jgi:hypothetical protein